MGGLSASDPSSKASVPAKARGLAGGSLSGLGSPWGRGAGEASFGANFLSGERGRGRGRFSRDRGRRCSRGLCSGLGDLDLRRLLSQEPRLSRSRAALSLSGRSLLSRGCLGLRALSRLLWGEHSLPRDRDPDLRLFFLLPSRCSWEELPGLPERERDLRRPRPQEPLLLSLLLSLAFLRLVRSRLLERSLEDLRSRALGRCLLAWSSPASGDADRELLSPECDERDPERALRCSLVATLGLWAFFPPRELDLERERVGDRSSTTLWVVAGRASGLGGASGSTAVTQVTVRPSEPKKELRGGGSSSPQGSGGDGLCACATGSSSPWSLGRPQGPWGGSGSFSMPVCTV